MKNWKRLSSLLLVLAIMLVFAAPVFAADTATTGSLTIENTTDGKEYDLYRVFDLTYAGSEANENLTVAYTINSGWTGFFAEGAAGAKYIVDEQNTDNSYATVTVGGETKYVALATAGDAAAFANDALTYATANNIQSVATVTGNGGNVVTNNLPLGTYLMYPKGAAEQNDNSNGSVCSLTSTTPNATVRIKAEYPTIDKKINGEEDQDNKTTGMVEENTASIGDEVPYVVTGKVPDMTGYKYYYYILNDTLSDGLTFNNDVEIKIGDTTLTSDKYTVTNPVDGDAQKIKINILNFIDYQSQAGQPITITYTATVNENAVIGNGGNTNTVKLTYSNDPTSQSNGTPSGEPGENEPVGESPEEVTTTYVTAIRLTKVNGEGNILEGATFTIKGTQQNVGVIASTAFEAAEDGTYYRLKNGQYTMTAPTEATSDKYDSTTTKYKKVVTTDETVTAPVTKYEATGTVDANGVLTFNGLGDGTYTITEIEAPNGYNLLTSDIKVVVSFDSKSKTWSATQQLGSEEAEPTTVEDGTIALNVVNQSGAQMPSTGGIGTTIFYVVGGVLVIGAGVLLVTKKRMKN